MVRPPYQVVVRLVGIAEAHWPEVDAAYPGEEIIRLPFDRFLNRVYGWAVSRMNGKQREEWETMLLAPLPKPKEAEVAEQKVSREIVGDDDGTWAALVGMKKG